VGIFVFTYCCTSVHSTGSFTATRFLNPASNASTHRFSFSSMLPVSTASPVATAAVGAAGQPEVVYNVGQFTLAFGNAAVYGPGQLPQDKTSVGGWLGFRGWRTSVVGA
jgi:hypothetical protein